MVEVAVIGVDLAWGEGKGSKLANETGLVAATADGAVVYAGWTRGLADTARWITERAARNTLVMVDAPLVVDNLTGQRLCEKQVGQRYGKWKVSANSTNLSSPHLAGVALRERLEERGDGWGYHDGRDGPPRSGRWLSEVYPYTTLVGAPEFGYDTERPPYKRKPRAISAAEWKAKRAEECDKLVKGIETLRSADPPLDISTHTNTWDLTQPSPMANAKYKTREDLIDAVLCAWTGLLWRHHGLVRCQVLGDPGALTPAPTIVAPCRPEQRPPL